MTEHQLPAGDDLDRLIHERVFLRAGRPLVMPPYSREIHYAWLVVQALADRYFWDIISPMQPGALWWAALGGRENSDDYEASGQTAPEAICRVALLAIEGEQGEGE